jgi:hypothetical protein
MNMFKSSGAKTTAEYFKMLQEPRKSDIKALDAFIKKTVPKLKPFMISGMLGYGKYRYKSSSGREGDWAVILLASQKNYISLYACGVHDGKYVAEAYKKQLPKANIGKSCIRFKKLEDIDLKIIKEILLKAAKFPMSAA